LYTLSAIKKPLTTICRKWPIAEARDSNGGTLAREKRHFKDDAARQAARGAPAPEIPTELAAVIDAWPRLPAEVREEIARLVSTAITR
jgi:hypothetical protein